MIMKRHLMAFIGLFFCIGLMAAPVSKDAARQKALQFLSGRSGNVARSRRILPVKLELKDAFDNDQLYVFNVGQKEGFVIVSGDDCTGDVVLGYADMGELTEATMPDNMRAWLQGYADQIRWMQANSLRNEVSARRAAAQHAVRQPVAEQLSCQWNQDWPYNCYSPLYVTGGGKVVQAATGCVATAVAQVLYHHGKRLGVPTTTLIDTPEYACERDVYEWTDAAHTQYQKIANIPSKPKRTFDWSKMLDVYADDAKLSDATEEVSRLMEYVGAALKMDYGSTSLAYGSDIPFVLAKCFGYDSSVRHVYRDDFSYTEWLDMIYKELTTNGPVLYAGASTGGGHQFVIDGYSAEDYFYVNWGWGGYCNGFFKLSVLYSQGQGIGGSTSDDGYSYRQEAIVNVKPVSSGSDEFVRLTLRSVDIPKEGTQFSRASVADDFKGVALNSVARNKTGEDHSFDVGWALVDGSQLTVFAEDNRGELYPTRESKQLNFSDVSFGAGLTDGDYILTQVSREHGMTQWLTSLNGDCYYIKATISGNTLTLKPVGTPKLSATLTIGDCVVGKKADVTVEIKNEGDLYSGDIILYEGNNVLLAKQVEIPTGSTYSCVTPFYIKYSGDYDLKLCYNGRSDDVIATKSFFVEPQTYDFGTDGDLGVSVDASTGNIAAGALSFDNSFKDDYAFGFYGSTLKGHIKLVNRSATDNHTSGITVCLLKLEEGDKYAPCDETICHTDIPKNQGTQTVDFEFNNLSFGTSYMLTFLYNDIDWTQFAKSSAFSCACPVHAYSADGKLLLVAPLATVTTPAGAQALDISLVDGVTTVVPNTNPNTIYFVGSSMPAGLEGKNVVQNDVAPVLKLADGYGFYTPKPFKAATAIYTRTFTTGSDGTTGWTTIVLPYDVSTVKADGNVLDWYRCASDKDKDFWLANYVSEGDGTVGFGYADKCQAYMPYLIAVPGDNWGDAKKLTDKPMTFEATDVNIAVNNLAAVSGSTYSLTGTLAGENVTDSYVLNTEGSAFEKATTAVPSFRAYIKTLQLIPGVSVPSLDKLTLAIGQDEPTGVGGVSCEKSEDSGGVYNLAGQHVAAPTKGLYIMNGKKVLVK